MAANPTIDLATLADVKSYLGGEWTSAQDAELQRELTALSQACASYCGRNFLRATYVEQRNGTGTSLLVLRNSPIVSIASLTIGGVARQAESAPGKGDGYVLDGKTLYAGGCYIYGKGRMNVVVTYTAGYLPITDANCDIPFDLRQSVVEAVADRYKRRSNIGILSKSIAGETITYGSISIPKSVAQVWDMYQDAAYGY